MNPKKTILDLSPQHARRRAGWWRRLSAAGLTLGLACLIQPANAQQGPAPTTGSFGAAVLADTPVAFWQLNEIGDAATNGLHAYDFTGHGYSGTYGADAYIWTNGVSAPQPPTYSGFATNQGALLPTVSDANSVVTLPPLNLNTNEVTFLMWINPSANEATYTGLLMNRTPAADAAGIGFGGGQNGSGQAELGYTWNDNSGSTYGFHSALYPQVGNWSLAALVIESNQATLYLDYIDQSTGLTVLSSAVNSLAHTAEAFSGGATMLGSDVVNGNAADSTRVFAGDISDAAVFNYALSAAQINALFGAGIGQQGFPPSITGQPASQYVLAGTTTQFKATGIDGSAPFAYQWTLNSSPIAASNTNFTGVNSNTLTVLSAAAADAGTYVLTVTNLYGMVVSSNATLAISTPALVGEWLNGTTAATNLADVSGFSPTGTHDAYVVGSGGFALTNDIPPAPGTNSASQALWLYDGATALSISNSSTTDANYTNTFDNQINQQFTVSFWAKGLPGAWSSIVSKDAEGDPGAWAVRGGQVGASPTFTVRDGGVADVIMGSPVYGNSDDMESSVNLDNNWHLYSGTFNAGTGYRNLYLDGVIVAQSTNNVAYNLEPVSHLVFGTEDRPPGNSFGYNGWFTGEIYDVRLYNYELSAEQIGALFGFQPPLLAPVKSTAAFLGGSAHFSPLTSGTHPIAYQWTLNGTPVNQLADATNFTGANSNTLTILSASLADAGSYQLLATNAYGNTASSLGTLAVYSANLVGQWFSTNNSLADISGYSPAGTHDGYDAAGNGAYAFVNDAPPGRTGNALSLSGTAIAISNSATSDASYTNTFDDSLTNALTLAFWAKGFPSGWSYMISKNGDGGSPNAGWNMRRDGWYGSPANDPCWTIRSPGGSFTLGAGGFGWDPDDMGSPSVGITNTAWHHYAGTYSQLTGIRNLYVDGVLAAQENNNGAYNLANYSHVVIGGFEGSPGGTINNFLNAEFYDVRLYNYDLSSNAVAALAAVPDPAIMANPQPTTAYVGLSAQFITAVEGTGPFTYQWRINGTNLVNGTLGGALVSGATSDALTIANLTTNLVGTFIIDVVVTGANGTATSRTGTLTVVPTAVPPAANLVGAWLTGAASLADVSGFQPKGTHDGYGVTGTGTPSATFAFTNDVPSGQAGQSLWLYDGSTSIAISNSASGDANYTNTFDDTINIAFTVTCWAKGIPGSWATFVAKDGEGTVGWMSRVNGSEDPCFTIRGTGGTDDMAEGNNSNDGNWHFYAGTYDSVAGNRDLYVDGQLVVSETGNVEYTLAPNAHLAFGSRDTSGSSYGNFFTGEIYGVRIYDTALTAAEVNYLQLPTAPPARPAFSGSPAVINGKLVLQWSAGSLQQATNLTGPWVPSGATSPYTNNLAVPQLFFRLSNP